MNRRAWFSKLTAAVGSAFCLGHAKKGSAGIAHRAVSYTPCTPLHDLRFRDAMTAALEVDGTSDTIWYFLADHRVVDIMTPATVIPYRDYRNKFLEIRDRFVEESLEPLVSEIRNLIRVRKHGNFRFDGVYHPTVPVMCSVFEGESVRVFVKVSITIGKAQGRHSV